MLYGHHLIDREGQFLCLDFQVIYDRYGLDHLSDKMGSFSSFDPSIQFAIFVPTFYLAASSRSFCLSSNSVRKSNLIMIFRLQELRIYLTLPNTQIASYPDPLSIQFTILLHQLPQLPNLNTKRKRFSTAL